MFCRYLHEISSLLQVILFVIDQVTADTKINVLQILGEVFIEAS